MKKCFFILITLFACLVASANNINLKASAPNAVASGQQFRLEYTVNGDGKDFRAPEFTGFDILMGPSTSSSMSTQIINGKVSSQTSKTYTFVILALQEGTYTIPSATVKVDGSQYTSNSLTVKVLPADQANQSSGANNTESTSAGVGANDVMVRLSLSKSKVFEGEALVATIKLYTVNGQTQMTNAKFPEFNGFTVQEIDLPDQKSFELEHYNGRNYYSVTLKQYLLFPQRSGKLDISPATLDLSIPVRTQQRARSIFDDFFDSYQNVNKTVTSSLQSVEVKPLPFGKPETFLGGVGEFKISSSVSATELNANEALTVKIVISGSGNIKFVKDPQLKIPADFEEYDPKVDLNVNVSKSGMTGSKTIEYTLIPRFGGNFELPPVEFTYFDINNAQYKRISTQAYKIKVAKGTASESSSTPVASGITTVNQESLRLLGSDIRFIKKAPLSLTRVNKFLHGSTAYLLWYIISSLLFVTFFIIYRKRVAENANIALMRNKKANKVASKRLKIASRYLKTHQKEPFYDELLKAMWGYLSDKLNISLSELNKDNVEFELSYHGADELLIKQLMDIVTTCEFARYSPVQSDEAMDKLYESTVDAIDKMEGVIKDNSRNKNMK